MPLSPAAKAVRKRVLSCERCSLHKSPGRPVAWSGPTPLKHCPVAVIGEAPGETEADVGKPFVGAAGQLLRRMMTEAGLSPSYMGWLNSVSCRPSWNRDPKPAELRACLPGETLIEHGEIEVGYRRVYEGPMVRVSFLDGGDLTGTPNHPVLTEQGWVPLGQIQEGDEALGCKTLQGMFSSNPDPNEAPASFTQVFNLLLKSRKTFRERTISVDFHGDGIANREVEIVPTHSRLPDDVSHFLAFQHLGEGILVLSDEIRSGFGATRIKPGIPGRAGQFPALLLRPFGKAQGIGLAPAPNLGVHVSQGFENSYIRNLELLGNLCGGESLSIEPGSLHTVETSAMKTCGYADFLSRGEFDSGPTQVLVDGYPGGSELSSESCLIPPGLLVEKRKVIRIERRTSNGHVYNLQTAEGWYLANGIIVKNCRSNLQLQLSVLKPRFLLLVGRISAAQFRPDIKLQDAHGRPFMTSDQRFIAYPIYHPAALMYGHKARADLEPKLRTDLANFCNLIYAADPYANWPDTCESCDEPVERYDPQGVAFCHAHFPKATIDQMKLFA